MQEPTQELIRNQFSGLLLLQFQLIELEDYSGYPGARLGAALLRRYQGVACRRGFLAFG